jgi:hypothetical protein
MNLQEITAAVAPLIGGTVEIPPSWSDDEGRHVKVDGYYLGFRESKNNQISIVAFVPPALSIKIGPHYGSLPEFPSIKVSAGRSPEAIAKEIARRIKPEAAAALAAYEARANEQTNARAQVEKHAADLRAAVPGIDVRFSDDRATEAAIYLNQSGRYVNGRLSSSGSIYIERISGITIGNAAVIFNALKQRD